jgi:glyoxylase-like metal-dependent hydrolase (beta-lactamase superfamily II)
MSENNSPIKSLKVQGLFDPSTSTVTYIISNLVTKTAIIIDPVLDYEQASSTCSTTSMTALNDVLLSEALNPQYILETHVHADHLTAAYFLKEKFPQIKVGISKRIKEVQNTFATLFNLSLDEFKKENYFDIFFEDHQSYHLGDFEMKIIPTPGHTPACLSFYFPELKSVFTGDALFMPDSGTGRCDFPGGSASELYTSIHDRLYQLPEETIHYTGHDYQPGAREVKFKSTIKEQKESNIHIKAKTTHDEFVIMRNKRDQTLSAPKLLLPSLQINIRGGRLPSVEKNNIRYLKIPLNLKT